MINGFVSTTYYYIKFPSGTFFKCLYSAIKYTCFFSFVVLNMALRVTTNELTIQPSLAIELWQLIIFDFFTIILTAYE